MSNYIDREALEKSIHTGMTIIEAMQAIIDAPTYSPAEIMAQQWVPVSERLPTNAGEPENLSSLYLTGNWIKTYQRKWRSRSAVFGPMSRNGILKDGRLLWERLLTGCRFQTRRNRKSAGTISARSDGGKQHEKI